MSRAVYYLLSLTTLTTKYEREPRPRYVTICFPYLCWWFSRNITKILKSKLWNLNKVVLELKMSCGYNFRLGCRVLNFMAFSDPSPFHLKGELFVSFNTKPSYLSFTFNWHIKIGWIYQSIGSLTITILKIINFFHHKEKAKKSQELERDNFNKNQWVDD